MASLAMTTTLATGNKRRRRGSGSAFTLIELSIVVFIIMIMMAVSVPYFAQAYQSSLLDSAGRSLIITGQFARLQSVMRQQPVVLFVDREDNRMWVTQTMVNEYGDQAETMLKEVKLHPRVRIVSVIIEEEIPATGKTGEIVFYPNGTCDSAVVTLRGVEPGIGLEVELDPVTTRAVATPVKL